jgi:hypothetical protein
VTKRPTCPPGWEKVHLGDRAIIGQGSLFTDYFAAPLSLAIATVALMSKNGALH